MSSYARFAPSMPFWHASHPSESSKVERHLPAQVSRTVNADGSYIILPGDNHLPRGHLVTRLEADEVDAAGNAVSPVIRSVP